MSEVKRYAAPGYMHEAPEGLHVLYSDYADLQRRWAEAEALATRLTLLLPGGTTAMAVQQSRAAATKLMAERASLLAERDRLREALEQIVLRVHEYDRAGNANHDCAMIARAALS